MEEKKKNFIQRNIRWIVLAICIIILIDIVKSLWQDEIYRWDIGVYEQISYFISEPLTIVAKIITTIGSAYIIIALFLIIMIWGWKKGYGKYILSNLVLIFASNQILKRIIRRPRPELNPIVIENGFSFPSGHSMVSMGFYGLFMYFIYKKVKNTKIKWISCTAIAILILLIGISRIYLGVHYASDVLAGFCISLAYLSIFTRFIKLEEA